MDDSLTYFPFMGAPPLGLLSDSKMWKHLSSVGLIVRKDINL